MNAKQKLQKHSDPAGDSPENFKSVFRNHPAGVAVVTLPGLNGPVGFTVTSVASVSADPAILVFSITAGSSSREAIDDADSVVVNFLAHDQQQVAKTFAQTGIERFANIAWEMLPTGESVLDGSAGWIQGQIDQRVPVGGSLLIVVRANQSYRRDDAHPLVYVDRTYHQLGVDSQVQ